MSDGVRVVLEEAAADTRGSFERTPLPHLLVHALSRGLTGSLVLHDDTRPLAVVVFIRGTPVAVDDGTGEDPFSIIARLTPLARSTRYAFHAERDARDNMPPAATATIDPLRAITVAARAIEDRAALGDTLAKIGERPLSLHPDAALERFAFMGNEVRVLQALRDGQPSYPALRSSLGDDHAVATVAFSLVTTRHIDCGKAPLGIRATSDEAPPSQAVTSELSETDRVLRASKCSRRALRLVEEGDLAAARLAAREAKTLDPSNAEHLALHGYLVGIAGLSGETLREGLAELDAAIAREPDSDRALYYRGMLHRRLGQEPKALADFARAAELNPDNIAVQRELRAAPPPKVVEKPSTRPVARPRRVPPVVLALGALLVLVGLYSGGTWVAHLLRRPPAAEQMLRAHLVHNEVDHALGPAHTGGYSHEDALDALGSKSAAAAIKLLADPSRAEVGDVRSSKSFQQVAHEYLLHYANTVAKTPPPPGADASENPNFGALQPAWSEWLGKQQ